MDWFWLKDFLSREHKAEMCEWEKRKGNPIQSLIEDGFVVSGRVSGAIFKGSDPNASVRFREDDRVVLIPQCRSGTLGEALLKYNEQREHVEVVASLEDNAFKVSRRGQGENEYDALMCPSKPLEDEYEALGNVLSNCIEGALPSWNELLAGDAGQKKILIDSEELFQKLSAINNDENDPVFLVQGPPGTGKTHLIGKLANEWCRRGMSVLVSAFTNRAVDEMISKTVRTGGDDVVPIFRAGRQKICNELNQVAESKKVIPYPSGVIGTTLFKCATAAVENSAARFDVAVIDESSQVKLPSLFAVAMLAKRVVVVGDHKQLPPVIVQDVASRKEINEYRCSAFDYLEKKVPHYMMRETWRMNRNVCEFISRRYYDGDLTSNASAANKIWSAGDGAQWTKPVPGVLSIEVERGDEPSDCSTREAEIVADLIEKIEATHGEWLKASDGADPKTPPKDGVPYEVRYMISCLFRKQASIVRQAIRKRGIAHHLWHVDTVERNQGQTASVAILCVGAASPETAGRDRRWSCDPRRWNVALSRGRFKAYVVASGEFSEFAVAE